MTMILTDAPSLLLSSLSILVISPHLPPYHPHLQSHRHSKRAQLPPARRQILLERWNVESKELEPRNIVNQAT